MTAHEILRLARTFAALTDAALTTVGRRACGNDKIFVRLEQGSGCNTRSIERAAAWFSANWPQGARWPRGVARPKPPAPDSGAEQAAA